VSSPMPIGPVFLLQSPKKLERRHPVLPQAASSTFIADDEHVIASTLAAILRKNGYSARFFTSPLEALAAARSKAPDLPVPELTIPEPSGIHLALQIKEQNPDREVLLISGHPGRLYMLQGGQERGHYFRLISKPPHPSESLSETMAICSAPRPEAQTAGG
jgi:DNA-binding NtrC family response regulator